MNATITSAQAERMLTYLHAAFPESQSTPDDQLKKNIGSDWQKGVPYGFDGEEDMAIYVIASYVLRDSFDQNIPGAAMLLQDSSLSSREKAQQLEKYAKQVLYERQSLNEPERWSDQDIRSLEDALEEGKISKAEYVIAKKRRRITASLPCGL